MAAAKIVMIGLHKRSTTTRGFIPFLFLIFILLSVFPIFAVVLGMMVRIERVFRLIIEVVCISVIYWLISPTKMIYDTFRDIACSFHCFLHGAFFTTKFHTVVLGITLELPPGFKTESRTYHQISIRVFWPKEHLTSSFFFNQMTSRVTKILFVLRFHVASDYF